MQNLLILFATREGQTEKVAHKIAEHLNAFGATVNLVNAQDRLATDQLDLHSFDRLVFGASLHAGGLEKELVDFVNRNAQLIELKPRSFFLVLLSAASKDPELKSTWLADARHKMEKQLSVAFSDIEMIAGALPYSKYPRPLKWMMQRIAKQAGEATDTSRDYEYTDWQQVDQYAKRLLEDRIA